MPSKFTINAVDALALYYALERLREHNYGNGVVSVHLFQDRINLEVEERILAGHDSGLMSFITERYAMNGNGHHVGYERFTAHLDLYPMQRPLNGLTPFSQWYVIPELMDVEKIAPAEEPHEYTVSDAIEFLDENCPNWREEQFPDEDPPGDDVIQYAFDNFMGEGDYYPPDEDFAWQELEAILRQALEDLPEGGFSWGDESKGIGRHWKLGFAPDDPLHVYWIDPPPSIDPYPGVPQEMSEHCARLAEEE